MIKQVVKKVYAKKNALKERLRVLKEKNGGTLPSLSIRL
ncbi:MAG: hypothetical protein ACJA2Z_000001, partial [Candidatus Paceibacteria bacterium]